MSPESRVIWGLTLILPLLASVVLLFLITASSSSLRADFSVIKISVDGSTLDGLISTANQKGSQPTASTLGGATARSASGGFLTLGVWGWCAASSDSSRWVLAMARHRLSFRYSR